MEKEVTKVVVAKVRPRFRPGRRIRQITKNQMGLSDGDRRDDGGFARRRRRSRNKVFGCGGLPRRGSSVHAG